MASVFVNFANFTTVYSVVLGILALLLYFKGRRLTRVFCIYLSVAASIDLVACSFAESGMNNLVFFHLFTFMELGLLGVFFSHVLKKLQVRFNIMDVILPFLAMIILNSLFVQSIDSFSTYSTTAVSIAIIVGCIFTFLKILDDGSDHDNKVIRWFLSGLFIYHMGSVVVLLTADLLLQLDTEVQVIIWIIRTFVVLLSKILFTSGILLEAKYLKKTPSYG